MNRHSVIGGRHDKPSEGGKRERILDAAVRIFADKGFYNAKVSEIARVAGVADGTIYLYFKSKDDLLISLFEDRMEQVNRNLRAARDEASEPVEQLRHMLGRHLELVEQNRQLAEVLTVELRQSAKFFKEYKQLKFGEFLKLLAEPIEAGQADGSIRADLDAPLVARALFGALDELVLAWVLGARKTQPRAKARDGAATSTLSSAGEQLARLFIEGITAPDAATAPPQRSIATKEKRRAT